MNQSFTDIILHTAKLEQNKIQDFYVLDAIAIQEILRETDEWHK